MSVYIWCPIWGTLYKNHGSNIGFQGTGHIIWALALLKGLVFTAQGTLNPNGPLQSLIWLGVEAQAVEAQGLKAKIP